jgi:pimeloyl-ACP methyl ester carboxylesterase
VRSWAPYDMTYADVEALWGRIDCPTLLVYGKESWASDPAADGRIRHFRKAQVVSLEGAGHWVHHDRLEEFIALTQGFLGRA